MSLAAELAYSSKPFAQQFGFLQEAPSPEQKKPPNMWGLTIDHKHSRDLDDGFSITGADGVILANVHIANVAEEVEPNSPKDIEAKRRKQSLYYRHSLRLPMLPHTLTKSLSLTPEAGKNTITISIPFGYDLSIREEPFVYLSRFQSVARLDHQEAKDILEHDSKSEIADTLHLASKIAYALGQARRRGDPYFQLYQEAQLTRPIETPGERGVTGTIEELMIAANIGFMRFMHQRDIPMLFRNHHVRVIDGSEEYLAYSKQQANLLGDIFPNAMVDACQSAEYSHKVRGHYGLNTDLYGHFTSPIRRAPDLINQQMVLALLIGQPLPYTVSNLEDIAYALNN